MYHQCRPYGSEFWSPNGQWLGPNNRLDYAVNYPGYLPEEWRKREWIFKGTIRGVYGNLEHFLNALKIEKFLGQTQGRKLEDIPPYIPILGITNPRADVQVNFYIPKEVSAETLDGIIVRANPRMCRIIELLKEHNYRQIEIGL